MLGWWAFWISIGKTVSHTVPAIENLRRMKAVGVAAWVEEAKEQAKCLHYGEIKPWNGLHCACRKRIAAELHHLSIFCVSCPATSLRESNIQ